jgi:hypothetical protein
MLRLPTHCWFLLGLLSGIARGQAPAALPVARLIGVYDATTGEPLVGAEVRDSASGSSIRTSSTGSGLLNFIEFIGPFAWIETKKVGYQPLRLRLNARDTAAVTILMERAVELPAVVATAPYRLDTDPGNRDGFERRCAVHNVSCVRSNVLSDHPARALSEIYGLSGADVMRTCAPRGTAKRCSVTVNQCSPKIFVDGFPAPPPPRGVGVVDDLDSRISPDDVAGVEVYPPGMAPLRFYEGSGCNAAIVIWTKRR